MATNNEKVTIQDIAKKANVSISTVSRVVSGNAKVAKKKHQAVLAAIDELNYRPNLFARGLASGQSMTIGVITQNIGSPFYDSIMHGIIDGFRGSNYSPFITDGQWNNRHEQHLMQTLLGRRVDGMIIVGGTLKTNSLNELNQSTPVVIVARHIPEFSDRCLYVDNFKAAYTATKHLIDANHRQIAHISGPKQHKDAGDRIEGFKQALADAGLDFNPELVVEGNFLQQSGVMAAESLLSTRQPFTAIFCGNDQMAFGARLALYRRGIRVPDDISLIGFDDQPTSAYMTPPLTTIHSPGLELGLESAKMMLKILQGHQYSPPKFEAKLNVRESVSIVR